MGPIELETNHRPLSVEALFFLVFCLEAFWWKKFVFFSNLSHANTGTIAFLQVPLIQSVLTSLMFSFSFLMALVVAKFEWIEILNTYLMRDLTNILLRAIIHAWEHFQALKKLRLTKEQSSMLESTFKLHNTLNPVLIHSYQTFSIICFSM